MKRTKRTKRARKVAHPVKAAELIQPETFVTPDMPDPSASYVAPIETPDFQTPVQQNRWYHHFGF